MAYLWLVFLTALTQCLLVTGDGDWPNPHENIEEGTFSAHCTSYCDIYGYYKPPKICYSPALPVYCCGNENFRECCVNANHSVGHRFPDVSSCPNSSWWLFHWRVILGFLGTMVSVLLVSACCYFCCLALFRDRMHTRRARRQVPAVSADVEPESRPRLQLMFDPESPHAFTPPDYNSLPKAPPDYAEIVQAYANAGFVVGEENANQPPHFNEPPPSYEASPGAIGGQSAPPVGNEASDVTKA